MIEITYHRSYNRVTIKGHAMSNEPGRDLVCAAASALAYTLAANVANLEANGQVTEAIVKLEAGDAEISCRPNRKYTAMVSRIFEAVCVGFELLARDHGLFVSYKIYG